MAKARTKGTTPVYVELPEGLVARLLALCERTGRNKTAEIADALERHLAAPPVVSVARPPLPPSHVEKPAPKKPRARKKPG